MNIIWGPKLSILAFFEIPFFKDWEDIYYMLVEGSIYVITYFYIYVIMDIYTWIFMLYNDIFML